MDKEQLNESISLLRGHNKYPGLFVVVEGPDGGGKTDATEAIYTALRESLPHREVLKMRSLHAGPIRDLVLSTPMLAKTELLLAVGSHHENTYVNLLPALKRGAIIVCDRYLDSMLAYQGYGRNLIQEVHWLTNQFLKELEPDVWVYVSAPRELCQERILKRGQLDRLEKEVEEFHARVEGGYEDIYARRKHGEEGRRVHRLFNLSTRDEFTQRCLQWATQLVENAQPPAAAPSLFTQEAIVIPVLDREDYLAELRSRIDKSYMPSSTRTDPRYHSKPRYCRSSSILELTHGLGYYQYNDDFFGTMVPQQELLNLAHHFEPGHNAEFLPCPSMFFAGQFPTRTGAVVQILTQLNTGYSWVRRKEDSGRYGKWQRWMDGGLPLIREDLHETLDTYT